jgi:hypothetical protein
VLPHRFHCDFRMCMERPLVLILQLTCVSHFLSIGRPEARTTMDAGPWGGGRKRSFGDRGIPKCNSGMRAERDPNVTQTEVLGRAGIRQSRIPREIRRATAFAINYWSGLLTSGLLHRSHQGRVISRISSNIRKLRRSCGHWRETCFPLIYY